MNKKVISALLCGTMILAAAAPALASDDGVKIALVGKSAGNAFFEIAASSFVETVEAEGGTVEVFCNGAKVTGITAGGGTTFSCILKDYGEGDYDIIVSSGNTVVYSRNIIVR